MTISESANAIISLCSEFQSEYVYNFQVFNGTEMVESFKTRKEAQEFVDAAETLVGMSSGPLEIKRRRVPLM